MQDRKRSLPNLKLGKLFQLLNKPPQISHAIKGFQQTLGSQQTQSQSNFKAFQAERDSIGRLIKQDSQSNFSRSPIKETGSKFETPGQGQSCFLRTSLPTKSRVNAQRFPLPNVGYYSPQIPESSPRQVIRGDQNSQKYTPSKPHLTSELDFIDRSEMEKVLQRRVQSFSIAKQMPRNKGTHLEPKFADKEPKLKRLPPTQKPVSIYDRFDINVDEDIADQLRSVKVESMNDVHQLHEYFVEKLKGDHSFGKK